MNANEINLNNKRHIWIAVMLSLIMPGLGQVYCGKLKRGLVLNFLNILPLPIIIWLFHLTTAPALMPITVLLILAGGIVQLIAMCDSAFLAKRASANYQLKDYNSLLVYLLFLFIVSGGSIGSGLYLRDQTLEAFRVPVASCYPTIMPDDRILANKSAYRSIDPKRGDLVVFTNPTNRHINFIKRVVAIAGDTVEIKDGQLYINNQKLQRQKLPQTTLDDIRIKVEGEQLNGEVFEEVSGDAKYKIILAKPPHDKMSHNFEKITVPKHHCFVLGDNRNLSYDSRHFGPILLATIKGRADYLYCPAKDWSRFGAIEN
ncbi:MAG: signal peptidase I [Planctomycetes bacterium]|nr:signal peptidase I [Planctomycetota bacterium]